jgi:hypothetical protein
VTKSSFAESTYPGRLRRAHAGHTSWLAEFERELIKVRTAKGGAGQGKEPVVRLDGKPKLTSHQIDPVREFGPWVYRGSDRVCWLVR